MDAPLAMTLTDTISQDDICQIKLSSSNNRQAVLRRPVSIKTTFFVKALDFSELSFFCKQLWKGHAMDRPLFISKTQGIKEICVFMAELHEGEVCKSGAMTLWLNVQAV